MPLDAGAVIVKVRGWLFEVTSGVRSAHAVIGPAVVATRHPIAATRLVELFALFTKIEELIVAPAATVVVLPPFTVGELGSGLDASAPAAITYGPTNGPPLPFGAAPAGST